MSGHIASTFRPISMGGQDGLSLARDNYGHGEPICVPSTSRGLVQDDQMDPRTSEKQRGENLDLTIATRQQSRQQQLMVTPSTFRPIFMGGQDDLSLARDNYGYGEPICVPSTWRGLVQDDRMNPRTSGKQRGENLDLMLATRQQSEQQQLMMYDDDDDQNSSEDENVIMHEIEVSCRSKLNEAIESENYLTNLFSSNCTLNPIYEVRNIPKNMKNCVRATDTSKRTNLDSTNELIELHPSKRFRPNDKRNT